MSKIAVLVAALAGVAQAQTPAPTATSVLANVQTYYTSANQLTATFRQTVTHVAFGKASANDGRVWIAKPSEFRFDYLKKHANVVTTAKTFTFDGTTFWYVDHGGKTLTKSAVTGGGVLPAAVSFLTGGNALATQFNVALNTSGTYGGTGATVLELSPKQPSAQFSKLFLVVAPDGHVRESIVIASNGDTNDFAFFSSDTKTAIASSMFVVTPSSFPSYAVETVGQRPKSSP